ncbi:hypothetical protein BO71DRAFT_486712 [Aspergillus ellipticus CBS 707.79]|uniref:Bul1 C-terminal domain-containing protein n=1 Tax=Aspergillus ellipticus CBS 707.79 TaxID=1448320 RepID=A0A319EIX6_9EURO|nr:hypothetical protein BO71DRAFT_486712 [Aspergillus ellipticus CBS 707.79]
MARPRVSIHIDNQADDAYCVFSTFDAVSGEIDILFENDITYSDLNISLEGRTTVTITNEFGGQTKADETFLKPQGLVDHKFYSPVYQPKPRSAETHPFTFIIPKALPPHSCSHSVRDTLVPYAHTELPPSLGIQPSPSRDERRPDDLSPRTISITYNIAVSFLLHDTHPPRTVSARRKICILPATSSERPPPPFAPSIGPPDHTLERFNPDMAATPFSAQETLRHGVLRKQLGQLSLSAVQPAPLSIHVNEEGGVYPMLTVHAQFESHHSSPPPVLQRMVTSLRATTFFSIFPWTEIPKNPAAVRKQTQSGAYVKSVPLGVSELGSVEWEGVIFPKGMADKRVHEACMQMPVVLPSDRALVPTFHSCLVARSYELRVRVEYRGGLSGNVEVDVPVTVVVG